MTRPKTLYHYTGAMGLVGILESRSLWASKIQFLNDSAELQYSLDLADRQLRLMLDKEDNDEEMNAFDNHQVRRHLDARLRLITLRNHLTSVANSNIFIISFSTVHDSLSQWRGYCLNGPGYCLEFDTDELCKRARFASYTLEQCIYDTERQNQEITTVICCALERLNAETPSNNTYDENGNALAFFRKDLIYAATRIKDPAFRHEDEWRLISPLLSSGIHFRIGTSTLIPYTMLSLIELGADKSRLPINRVTVGPNPNSGLANSALSDLLANYHIRSGISQVPYRNW